MNETEKLRVLIPHWIEHNQEHADKFRRWAEQAEDASEDILAAAKTMESANRSLKTALEKLGGAMSTGHTHD
jgi:hypothetical protein